MVDTRQAKGEGSLFVKCECGAKIPVFHDVAEMSHIVGLHAALHEEMKSNPRKPEEEFVRIEELLIAKIFEVACEA